jgi:hypothetical protein
MRLGDDLTAGLPQRPGRQRQRQRHCLRDAAAEADMRCDLLRLDERDVLDE